MRSPARTLAAEHLDIRHQLLEIGAFLDRLDGDGEPAPADDLRLVRIRRALAFLADPASRDRALKLSLLFSGTDAEC